MAELQPCLVAVAFLTRLPSALEFEAAGKTVRRRNTLSRLSCLYAGRADLVDSVGTPSDLRSLGACTARFGPCSFFRSPGPQRRRFLHLGRLGAGILWIGTFIFALAIAFLCLSVGVVAGWVALRERPNRTWLYMTLVAVSILGLLARAFYIKFLLFGV